MTASSTWSMRLSAELHRTSLTLSSIPAAEPLFCMPSGRCRRSKVSIPTCKPKSFKKESFEKSFPHASPDVFTVFVLWG